MAVFGGLLEQVLIAADESLQGGHQIFSDGVQRWVGDLGEELLEIVEQQLGLVRQHRQGGVAAHGPHRLGAVKGHGRGDGPQLFFGIPEGSLLLLQCSGV